MVDQYSKTERVRLTLKFEEEKPIFAIDLSAFIFDLNAIHASCFKYLTTGSAPLRYSRNTFRLRHEYSLEIARIRFESPGLVEFAAIIGIIGGTAGAIWALVQTVERISNWPLDREKKRLEIEKLRRELGLRGEELDVRAEPFLALPLVSSAVRQLEQNPLKPNDLFISIEGRDAPSPMPRTRA
jgi:hypothetical protein